MPKLNDMPQNDLLSLYEDALELNYPEMIRLLQLEFKRRNGEVITQGEVELAFQAVKDSGGTLHIC